MQEKSMCEINSGLQKCISENLRLALEGHQKAQERHVEQGQLSLRVGR